MPIELVPPPKKIPPPDPRQSDVTPGIGPELGNGFAGLALRTAAAFVMMGFGYFVLLQFGGKGLAVLIALVIAVRLHFEIAWIEKNVPPDEPVQKSGRDRNRRNQ